MTEERYEDYLGELPQFQPDPRQAQFLESAQGGGGYQKVKLDQRLGKVEIANIGRGWRASSPDLGFLQSGMKKLIELKKLHPTSKKQVAQFIKWGVQRVVRVTVSAETGSVRVNFWTKDDHGVYEYGFAVALDE
jgi:hypothetical protein